MGSSLGRGRARPGRCAVPAIAALASFGLAGAALAQQGGYVSAPKAWELDLQESATVGMDRLTALHDGLLIVISIICLFVLGLLVYVMWRFHESRNPTPSLTTHNTVLEVAWTVIPILILVGIAVPSFRLLYFTDKNPDAEMTVKVIGHQWYWAYEYPDFKNAKGEAYTFDSRIIAENEIDPKKGQIRMLSVDNELIVPVNTNIRVVMTSEDVMHGWAVPAFGMKRTVVPGRLNESWFNVEKIGLFYGQCSQICGNNHSYMPIAVRSVSKEDFKKWIDGKAKAAANDGPANGFAAVAPATR